MLRGLHDAYGVRTVINVFFETPDSDFTLAAMPAWYRGEWADSADWLRLAFHARAEYPGRRYARGAASRSRVACGNGDSR